MQLAEKKMWAHLSRRVARHRQSLSFAKACSAKNTSPIPAICWERRGWWAGCPNSAENGSDERSPSDRDLPRHSAAIEFGPIMIV
ncbi:hypothetical protein FFR93_17645 [Rhizobium sp. MHM7A]|nr:hypothetical protein FFR93_17645 [Rhizobium sp. MHM7A]